eukprot:gene3913-4886_t
MNNQISTSNNNEPNKYNSKEFKFIDEFSIPFADDNRVERFRHKESGLTLILHYCPGPKCNASIVVPTESANNLGLPHTLEHLVFEGCEDIPYRDYINVLSSRCFSAVSNAYTTDDHTCYSIESVGPDGILNYLPTYIKFILTPTLKHSDFVTEVYHVDSQGKEQGVVFCEMQARENTLEDLQEMHMSQMLYEGSGYSYCFGGLTKDIATLDNDMVQKYHGQYYHPENITIVIQGCIDSLKLFEALDAMKFPKSPFSIPKSPVVVPWSSEIPPLLESKSRVVKFASDSEESGSVVISWRGPLVNDFLTINALSVLFRYFHGNSSDEKNSQKSGEEEEEEDVGDPNLFNQGSLYNRAIELLKSFREKGFPEGNDILKTIIEKEQIKLLEGFEEDPHGYVFGMLLTDIVFLHPERKEIDIKSRFNSQKIFEELKQKDNEYWFDLIDRYLINNRHVEVILIPDCKLGEQQSQQTKNKIKERYEAMGEEGRAERDRYIKDCIENNKSFPEEYKQKMPNIPDIKNVPLLDYQTQLFLPNTEQNTNSFAIQQVIVNSHFIHTTIYFYVQDIPNELRPYLSIFQTLLYEVDTMIYNETTMKRELVPYKKACEDIARDTVYIESVLGFNASLFSCTNSELFKIYGTCEPHKYKLLLHWLLNGFFNFSLTPKRLLNLVTNMMSSLNDFARDSSTICGNYAIYSLRPKPETSNEASISLFQQKEFLKHIQKVLKEGTEQQISKINDNIYQLRNHFLMDPSRMLVQISHPKSLVNHDIIQEFTSAWNQHLKESQVSIKKKRKLSENPLYPFNPLQRHPTQIPANTMVSISLKGSESNNLVQYVPFPISVIHPDYTSVSVLCNIFTSKEGEIRSKGYSYGYNLASDSSRKILIFSLNDSSSPAKALDAFYRWLQSLETQPSDTITKFSIDTSISNEVYDFFSSRSSPSDLIVEAFLSLLRGFSSLDEEINSISKYSQVTVDSIMTIYGKYFKEFLNKDNKFIVLTTNPSASESIDHLLKTDLQINLNHIDLNQLWVKYNN